MVGCGDVGQRLVRDRHRNGGGPRWLALTSQREKRDTLRALGASPLVGNLDDARTLRRLAGLAHRIVHLAPPPGEGEQDPRTRNLLRSLRRGRLPRSVVYGSTSGVYGDCGGDWVSETRPLRATTARARRRVDAERSVRSFPAATRASVLRIPRAKLGIKWEADRGKDVASAPWYKLGPNYGEPEGTRINDHHTTLAEKKAAREQAKR